MFNGNLKWPSRLEGGYAASLAYSDFRYMWGASFFAGAASWALIVARGLLVYHLTDSALLVGLVTFAAMIPRVLVTPFTGYLSDRFDRRSVLVAMYGVNFVQNILLALLVLTGHVEIWLIAVMSLLDGSARAAQMPASQALIPNLVPRSLLLNGIALNQAAGHGSRLMGPAAIAPLLGVGDAPAAFFLASGLYGVSFILTTRVRTPSTGRIDQRHGLARNLLEGVAYVYRTPVLLSVMLLALFHCGLTMSFESLLPVISSQRLDAEGAGFSYLMMSVGAGALVSVLLLATVRNETTKGRLFLNLGVFSGVTPGLLAMSGNMPLAMLSAAGMGAAQAGFMTLTHTMIQAITPDHVRGRVGAVYSVHIGGMMATANLVNGGLADAVNASMLLLVGGAAFVVVMLVGWQRATLRRIFISGLRAEPVAAD